MDPTKQVIYVTINDRFVSQEFGTGLKECLAMFRSAGYFYNVLVRLLM